MFALEISFPDESSRPETLLVRRPRVIVGGHEDAHVVIEDMKTLDYDLLIVRGLGRDFQWQRARCRDSGEGDKNAAIAGEAQSMSGESVIDLGAIRIRVIALDLDLALREGEPPDSAGVRVLRSATSRVSPRFPALKVLGDGQAVVSFAAEQTVYIGRSRGCALRLDRPEISSMHARVGFEEGRFWIEDLGSTNGTFLNGQQVAGRVGFAPGASIVLARDVELTGVVSSEQITEGTESEFRNQLSPREREEFPVLVATSEVCRPAKLVLPKSGAVRIGRDPASDMWLGAPHVSRLHCEVFVTPKEIVIEDRSTNGTMVDGILLRNGEGVKVLGRPRVIDFGGGVCVAICFDKDQEETFMFSAGSPLAFAVDSVAGRDTVHDRSLHGGHGAVEPSGGDGSYYLSALSSRDSAHNLKGRVSLDRNDSGGTARFGPSSGSNASIVSGDPYGGYSRLSDFDGEFVEQSEGLVSSASTTVVDVIKLMLSGRQQPFSKLPVLILGLVSLVFVVFLILSLLKGIFF